MMIAYYPKLLLLDDFNWLMTIDNNARLFFISAGELYILTTGSSNSESKDGRMFKLIDPKL